MKRRNFIKGILGLAAVPVVAKAGFTDSLELRPVKVNGEPWTTVYPNGWELNREVFITRDLDGYIVKAESRQAIIDKKPTKLIIRPEHLKEAEKLLKSL